MVAEAGSRGWGGRAGGQAVLTPRHTVDGGGGVAFCPLTGANPVPRCAGELPREQILKVFVPGRKVFVAIRGDRG